MKNVITITGYSCAGKSTLINEIERLNKFKIIKFGETHRKCVKNNGYLYAKDWIMKSGFEAYEKALVLTFKEDIQSAIKENKKIIIDGLFSDKCFQFLKNMEEIHLINIVVNTEYENRIRRMMERQGLDYGEAVQHMHNTDSIKKKAGVANIIKDCNYVIDGNRSINYIKEECQSILKSIGLEFRDTPNKMQLER